MKRLASLGLVLVPLTLIGAAPRGTDALASPSLMVFEVGPDAKRVLLSEFRENNTFMISLESIAVRTADTASRRGIPVAMFYARSMYRTQVPVEKIPFDVADIRVTYYPARGERPAMIVGRAGLLWGARSWHHGISAPGLDVLAKHGIPTVDAVTSH